MNFLHWVIKDSLHWHARWSPISYIFILPKPRDQTWSSLKWNFSSSPSFCVFFTCLTCSPLSWIISTIHPLVEDDESESLGMSASKMDLQSTPFTHFPYLLCERSFRRSHFCFNSNPFSLYISMSSYRFAFALIDREISIMSFHHMKFHNSLFAHNFLT